MKINLKRRNNIAFDVHKIHDNLEHIKITINHIHRNNILSIKLIMLDLSKTMEFNVKT